MQIYGDKDPGYDTARDAVIGYKDYELTEFEEAYTSKNWLVRIYKVLPKRNREKSFIDVPARRLMEPQEPDVEGTVFENKGYLHFSVGFNPTL